MWFPLIAVLVLEAFVGVVLWSVWKPFTDELRENPVVNVPSITLMLSVVLLPPLAWAIAHAT